MFRNAIFLLIICVLLLCAPLFATHDPLTTGSASLAQAGNGHLLGTDALGRDLYSRLLYGTQRTVIISLIALFTAIFPGAILGLAAGGSNWRVLDLMVTALINALLAFPTVLLALLLLTLLGRGLLPLAIAAGVPFIAPYAHFVRATVLAIRVKPHIEAAQALGARGWEILLRHILTNAVPDMLSYAGVMFSYTIITSAGLNFLGLGGDPSAPELGAMIQEGRSVLRTAPLAALLPCLIITLLVIVVNRSAVNQKKN